VSKAKRHVMVLFAISCSIWSGCQALNFGALRQNGKADPFQEEITSAGVLEGTAGYWKIKPDVVLKEIPVGTPVLQAQAVMEKHGFSSSYGSTEDDEKKSKEPKPVGKAGLLATLSAPPPSNVNTVRDSTRPTGSYLVCSAFRRTGWLTAVITVVTFYYQDGKVTHVEVTHSYDGP